MGDIDKFKQIEEAKRKRLEKQQTAEAMSDRVREIVSRQLDILETQAALLPEDMLDCLAKIALILQRIRVPNQFIPGLFDKEHTDKELMKVSGGLNDEDF